MDRVMVTVLGHMADLRLIIMYLGYPESHVAM